MDLNRRRIIQYATFLSGAAIVPFSISALHAAPNLDHSKMNTFPNNKFLPHDLKGRKTLVVYFSRTFNTAMLAKKLQHKLNADLLEINPLNAYPEDYLETVEQARVEKQNQSLPPLQPFPLQLSKFWKNYDTVYIGFPVWGMSPPAAIRTFLSMVEMDRKQLFPFITHAGYGIGDSMSVLKNYAPKATLQKPFDLECDKERDTMEAVDAWLS
ncbi:MAG: flavodoxin [Vibrio sp.]